MATKIWRMVILGGETPSIKSRDPFDDVVSWQMKDLYLDHSSIDLQTCHGVDLRWEGSANYYWFFTNK